MGYTHYYYQKKSIPQKKWEKIAVDCMKVFEFCEDNGIKIVYEYDNDVQSEVSDTKIRFNGFGNEGHETFSIWKDKPEESVNTLGTDEYFSFCKTARKPYDLAVGLVLLVVKKHSPNSIRVASDGDWDEDWSEIRRAYKILFEEDAVCPMEEEKV